MTLPPTRMCDLFSGQGPNGKGELPTYEYCYWASELPDGVAEGCPSNQFWRHMGYRCRAEVATGFPVDVHGNDHG